MTLDLVVLTKSMASKYLLFSCPVISNSLGPHELQHTRPLCPSPSPEVCPSSCPLHQWCHPAISSSDALFYCPQSFPASGTSNESAVHIRWPKYWSFSFSINPSNKFSGWFPLRLTGLISLLSKGLSEVFSSTIVWRHQRFTFFTVQLSQPYMITGKTIALTIMDLCKQSNVSAFQHTVWVCNSFPAKKQMSSDFMAAVTTASDFRAQEEEIYHYFHLSPLICHEVMGLKAMILAFLIFNFKPAFLLYPHQEALQFLFTFCH